MTTIKARRRSAYQLSMLAKEARTAARAAIQGGAA